MIAIDTRTITQAILNQWSPVSWDEFLRLVDEPTNNGLKGYYYNGRMRLESMSTGSDHSNDHHILIFLISLFATLQGIPLRGKDACSYRKTGISEFQPDASYYLGDRVDAVPRGVRVIDLDLYPLPDLVIEISDTSLSDDQGQKRLQYEDLKIAEYWILDVQNSRLLAFAITEDHGSRQIRKSLVLPNLDLDLIQEALQRSRSQDQSTIGAWWIAQLAAKS